jgi:N-acetylglucosamine-6-phosphate deacetylase
LTLAPELPGAQEVVEEARARGVAVAVGHSSASYGELAEAQEWGVDLVTHLFNAMGGMTSREPGTSGAALALEGLSVSLIADGLHVHPAMLKLAVQAKGAERVVLVSDAMPPVGTGLTDFPLYDMRISVQDGRCLTPEGRLAGSVLTMSRAVENMRRLAEVSLGDALAMATVNPARVIGVAGRKGSLEEGKDADLLVCDQDLNPLLTMVEGRIVYRSPEL